MALIGIDLGTTNSLVAFWSDSGATLIPNSLGQNLTPSIVSTDEQGVISVGQVAKERLISHPTMTASLFKRFMGTEKIYTLGKYFFSPEELSSFILRSLKNDAETFLGTNVDEAVISVPAYFNDIQRKATIRAAQFAGLKVERLISEPTAAAIAYGLHHEKSETKFLVFDLGGGTFDVSILELFENVMEVKSIAGDNYLGGEDFTQALVEYFTKEHGLDPEKLTLKNRALLYKQAESCKCQLSTNESAKIKFTYDNQSFESTIHRDEQEKINSPLMLRLRQPIERALRDSSMTPNDMDAVLLIGGATRMKSIRSAMGKMFGKLPYTNINPDEAVALGAAVQAALKERKSNFQEMILTDVCPYTLGTSVCQNNVRGMLETGFFLPIIERNTPIPVSREESLQTVQKNQKSLQVEIFQGESRRVQNNVKLGELHIDLVPEPDDVQQVTVRYTYDKNGILEVEVLIKKTGEKKRLLIEKTPGLFSKEELEARQLSIQNIKIHPRDKMENKLLLARGERMYEEAMGDLRNYIGSLLKSFEDVISLQDERKVDKAALELRELLDELERRFHY